ncbi:hypothetical protein IM40_09090 [Candidatus Paracaedimonas acanthamoebae]|nr:hypothetical protein IM40_09090 [Candidatus Paracaedimonas acanthamoebae]
MDLVKLRIFYTVAKFGNLTKAADFLNTSQSSLSRSMKEFEVQLRMKLFERHPRGLGLTLEGNRLFQHATELMQENEEFLQNFYNKDNEVRGELKIVTTPHMGASWLMSYVGKYLEIYPDIHLSILCKMENLNLQETDVAICTYIPHHPNLIQHPLKAFPMGLWASPSYLERYGIPKNVEELNHHHIISYGDNIISPYGNCSWILEVGMTPPYVRKPYLKINSLEGLVNAAKEGIGIAELSGESPSVKDSHLINVLPSLQAPVIELYYIYKENMKNSRRITSLRDYLQQQLSVPEARSLSL